MEGASICGRTFVSGGSTLGYQPLKCLNVSILGTAQVAQTKHMPNAPKALIVEPSRELAEQTLNNVKQFKKYVENPKLRYFMCSSCAYGDVFLPSPHVGNLASMQLSLKKKFLFGHYKF